MYSMKEKEKLDLKFVTFSIYAPLRDQIATMYAKHESILIFINVNKFPLFLF